VKNKSKSVKNNNQSKTTVNSSNKKLKAKVEVKNITNSTKNQMTKGQSKVVNETKTKSNVKPKDMKLTK
jgi:hypothetical protein